MDHNSQRGIKVVKCQGKYYHNSINLSNFAAENLNGDFSFPNESLSSTFIEYIHIYIPTDIINKE